MIDSLLVGECLLPLSTATFLAKGNGTAATIPRSMSYRYIKYQLRVEAVWITLNRPEVHNALNQQMLEELGDAIRRGDGESAASMVITGAGDSAFCSGGDVLEMRDFDPAIGRAFLACFADAIKSIRMAGKPVIARIDGFCLGGGNELNLSCDLSIASERSIFGQVGARVGGVPVVGATELLPGTVGEKKAKEIVFLCQRYTAADAVHMGLVNRVVPYEDLDRVVGEWTSRIAGVSPQALRVTKRCLNRRTDGILPSSEQLDEIATIYGTEEYREGMSAFLEKRRPDFRRFRPSQRGS
ncbi:MAG: enoyl-CoA hydratase-related protein [Pseudomonadota bacterium]